ncbi:MAG: hypothetical protein N4A48_01785 [Tepidibacter sp.]|jgi:uncharacterized protein YneF (UPF0154 family)|uniref:hypothetical protein n=1 Tax=Tepidibacter sp. TaxID=2529387 RepID=UPI0025D5ADD0|nr:hypothetical protein [Tepidibacter sp.]MCT4507486.1 hypothetical protein [Tepidibacter sp.]
MLNNFVGLIYKELIKGKIKDLKKVNKYSINKKEDIDIIKKIDSLLAKIAKYILNIFVFLIMVKINIYVSTVFLIGFIFYKKIITHNFKENMKNKTFSLKRVFDEVIKENSKLKIKTVMVMFILMQFSDYTKLYMGIIITLLVFTINDIYSNIKNMNENTFQQKLSK